VSKILIKGGCVLTMGRGNHTCADVLIEDGLIAEVGDGIRARDAEVIDGEDTIVMPGFVDTHRHTWESLFRYLGDRPEATPDGFGPFYGPDDMYAATMLGLVSAVDAGITAVVDWCEIAVDSALVEAALQAHSDSGIRSVFAFGASESGADWAEGMRRAMAATRGPLTRLAAGPRGPGSAAIDDIAAEWAVARGFGLRIHAHAGTSPSTTGSVAAIGRAGHLADDVVLVHGTHFGADDLDAVATAGASVVLTPASEMCGGLGAPQVQEFIDRQIRPGLGVDTERSAPGDMFGPMRSLISLQHAAYFDLKLAGKAGLPRLMTTREAIKHATIDGARAAGLVDTGVLEPGMQADVVVLRADRPNIVPINDPIGAVVWGMDTSNVDTVIVGGRILKRAGELTGDTARVRELALSARERVGAAAGVGAGTGIGR